MRDYEKPKMKEINVNLRDIIAVSNRGATENGDSSSLVDLFSGK